MSSQQQLFILLLNKTKKTNKNYVCVEYWANNLISKINFIFNNNLILRLISQKQKSAKERKKGNPI